MSGMAEASSRATRTMVLWVAVLILPSVPVSAQRTTFNPSIRVGAFYTDNVNFVGESGQKKASTGYTLGLTLPVDRQMRNGSLRLSYSTFFDSFRDVDVLDNSQHYFNLAYNYQPGRGTNLGINVRYSRTQNQGTFESIEGGLFFLSRRTKREYGQASFNYSRRLGSRFNLDLRGAAAGWSFDNISGVTAPPGPGLQDRRAFRFGVGVSKSINERLRIGFAYTYRLFDLEGLGEQDVQSLSLTFSYEVVQRVRLIVAAGGFSLEGTTVGGQPISKSGAQVTLALGRSWRLRDLRLNVRVAHVPNVGGAQFGTATITVLGVGISPSETVNWFWGLYGNVARRDPTSPVLETIESVALGGNLGRALTRILSLTFGGNWVDQVSNAQFNRGSFFRVNLGLVFSPLGRSKIATF